MTAAQPPTNSGVSGAESDLPFGTAAARWLKVSPERRKQNQAAVAQLLPVFGERPLSSIESENLPEELLAHLRGGNDLDGEAFLARLRSIRVFWDIFDPDADVLVQPFAVACATLGRDPDFCSRVERVRSADDPAGVAQIEASRYTLYNGQGRTRIARLLELAARTPVLTLSAGAVDASAPDAREWCLDELQRVLTITATDVHGSRTSIRRHGLDTIECGAKLLARRGAGRCLSCGTHLSSGHAKSAGGRSVRLEFCSQHDGESRGGPERDRQYRLYYEEPIRRTLEALAPLDP